MEAMQLKPGETEQHSPLGRFVNDIEAKADVMYPGAVVASMLRLVVGLSSPAQIVVKMDPPKPQGTPCVCDVQQVTYYPPETIQPDSACGLAAPAIVARIDPGDPLDIDRLLSVEGETPNSELSERGLLERFAGVVRLLSRVLAMKHCSVDQAATMGHIITRAIELANLSKNMAGGELNLNTLEIVRPGAGQTAKPPAETKPRRKVNWTPEQRAAAAERMRKVGLATAARRRAERLEGGGAEPGTFPQADADGSAGVVGAVAGNAGE